MTKFSVPMTILCSVSVEAQDKRSAIVAARAFIEAEEFSAEFLDGYNSAGSNDTTILNASGLDVEEIEFDEVVEIVSTVQPVMLAKVEPVSPEQVIQTPAATAGLRTFTIDIWRDGSIHTWEGNAATPTEAEAAAVADINTWWHEEWIDWEEMVGDVDGTSTIPHPAVMAPRIPEKLLTHYRLLADGLSDMIEGGRIKEGDIPDDYQWLLTHLTAIAELDQTVGKPWSAGGN